ncbi:hypothetical protein [Bernardetia sp.]|uniref:hypothetical protein n=1 Tax=Bernardetia sp. TaxID=1937974 RepID=UPI0025B8F104|nr:hypothetical protein [Bernardetia sp.]
MKFKVKLVFLLIISNCFVFFVKGRSIDVTGKGHEMLDIVLDGLAELKKNMM